MASEHRQLLLTQDYILCAVVISLLFAYITSLSKISLCPRFLKPSLKTEARGSSIRRLTVGDARTNWLSSLIVGKWVSHNRKSAAIKSVIVTSGIKHFFIIKPSRLLVHSTKKWRIILFHSLSFFSSPLFHGLEPSTQRKPTSNSTSTTPSPGKPPLPLRWRRPQPPPNQRHSSASCSLSTTH